MTRRDDQLFKPKAWIAQLLAQSDDPAALEVAGNLATRVNLWLEQRLWSINLAPELVLHDDRHVAQVDRLASELVAPLVGRTTGLTWCEAELLSCAAWLHDWGHVGGLVGLTTTGAQAFATTPQDVRAFHGMISRQLLSPSWKGMHGISDPAVSSVVGVLCAHHQGSSSFGQKAGKTGRVSDGCGGLYDVQPQSLASDLNALTPVGGSARISLERAQLLIALLRVADACDLGRHRVPDDGAAKGAFLARCIQSQAWRTIGQVETERFRWGASYPPELRSALDAVISEASRCAEVRENVGGAYHVISEILMRLAPFADMSPAVKLLQRYVEFTQEQDGYYQAHRSVRRVQFALDVDTESVGRSPCWTVSLVVAPNPPTTQQQAMRIVRADLNKELVRGDGDDSVREVLLRAGLRFTVVRSTGTAKQIYI